MLQFYFLNKYKLYQENILTRDSCQIQNFVDEDLLTIDTNDMSI